MLSNVAIYMNENLTKYKPVIHFLLNKIIIFFKEKHQDNALEAMFVPDSYKEN